MACTISACCMASPFTGHQIGGALSLPLGGSWRDRTGSYGLSFALAGLLFFGASLISVTMRERRSSSRYQPAVSAAGD